MKLFCSTLFLLLISSNLYSQKSSSNFITYDIDNFWVAYDKITVTKDIAKQYEYINKLYLQKGSPGLKAIMQARDYNDSSYIEAINAYPLFWNSIRKNTLKAKQYAKDIETDIAKIKIIYPTLKPSKIYFTIGALLTGGTTMNGMVLIGSEISFADNNIITTEFPKSLEHLVSFFKTNPINDVSFGNTHEYIHTQQKTTIGNTLLAQSVLEGVAEFVAVIATSKKSTVPAMEIGKQNEKRIREVFSNQMFNSFTGFWLYSNGKNEFNVRDLGYYVGYEICERYYNNANDKKLAIKQMIELDYNNEIALNDFVNKSKYFTLNIEDFKEEFEIFRPTVSRITQFKNGDKNVNPKITEITIEFSKPMNDRYRNFEIGPLGEKNALHFKKFKGMSEDKKSITFEIALEPKQQYQIIVNSGFRSNDTYALSLKPYLIDFKTGEK
jgi:hypothetical protein